MNTVISTFYHKVHLPSSALGKIIEGMWKARLAKGGNKLVGMKILSPLHFQLYINDALSLNYKTLDRSYIQSSKICVCERFELILLHMNIYLI